MFKTFVNSLLLTDVKTGIPSYSRTMTLIAFFIINLKLIFSGIQLGPLTMSSFSGVDYGAALAAVAALHVGNKAVSKAPEDKSGN